MRSTTCKHPCRGQQPASAAPSLAYTLFEGLRRVGLGDTELETASPDRIRLTLLRVGAVVVRNTRRIRFLLGSTWPYQDLFHAIAWRLDSS